MKSLRLLFLGLFLFGLGMAGIAPAAAQETGPESSDTVIDPPQRVGRVSFLSGAVSWREDAQASWSTAELNSPVIGGNAFWSEPGARVEVRVGTAALRMDGSTQLDIEQINDALLRINVPQGTINVRVAKGDVGNSVQILTPRGAVNILAPGSYRIEAGTETAPTALAVLDGSAQLVTDGTLTVKTGETALLSGSNPVSFDVVRTQPTAFDAWAMARDSQDGTGQSIKYVSTEMTGYEALDTNGTWQTVPEYGAIWAPALVPAGWAPYRFGHWAWIAPWGWTWIDDAPWGFAPFHYGRWVFLHGRWFWWPGHRVVRPVFAPALVVFVGHEPDHKAVRHDKRKRDSKPFIGWFPLGPHEEFHPSFRTSPRFVRDINSNILKDGKGVIGAPSPSSSAPEKTYANRTFLTTVPQDVFGSKRSVHKTALDVPSGTLKSAPVIGSTPPVAAPVRAPGTAPAAPAPRPIAAPPERSEKHPDERRDLPQMEPQVQQPHSQSQTQAQPQFETNRFEGRQNERMPAQPVIAPAAPPAPLERPVGFAPASPSPAPVIAPQPSVIRNESSSEATTSKVPLIRMKTRERRAPVEDIHPAPEAAPVPAPTVRETSAPERSRVDTTRSSLPEPVIIREEKRAVSSFPEPVIVEGRPAMGEGVNRHRNEPVVISAPQPQTITTPAPVLNAPAARQPVAQPAAPASDNVRQWSTTVRENVRENILRPSARESSPAPKPFAAPQSPAQAPQTVPTDDNAKSQIRQGKSHIENRHERRTDQSGKDD